MTEDAKRVLADCLDARHRERQAMGLPDSILFHGDVEFADGVLRGYQMALAQKPKEAP